MRLQRCYVGKRKGWKAGKLGKCYTSKLKAEEQLKRFRKAFKHRKPKPKRRKRVKRRG